MSPRAGSGCTPIHPCPAGRFLPSHAVSLAQLSWAVGSRARWPHRAPLCPAPALVAPTGIQGHCQGPEHWSWMCVPVRLPTDSGMPLVSPCQYLRAHSTPSQSPDKPPSPPPAPSAHGDGPAQRVRSQGRPRELREELCLQQDTGVPQQAELIHGLDSSSRHRSHRGISGILSLLWCSFRGPAHSLLSSVISGGTLHCFQSWAGRCKSRQLSTDPKGAVWQQQPQQPGLPGLHPAPVRGRMEDAATTGRAVALSAPQPACAGPAKQSPRTPREPQTILLPCERPPGLLSRLRAMAILGCETLHQLGSH